MQNQPCRVSNALCSNIRICFKFFFLCARRYGRLFRDACYLNDHVKLTLLTLSTGLLFSKETRWPPALWLTSCSSVFACSRALDWDVERWTALNAPLRCRQGLFDTSEEFSQIYRLLLLTGSPLVVTVFVDLHSIACGCSEVCTQRFTNLSQNPFLSFPILWSNSKRLW